MKVTNFAVSVTNDPRELHKVQLVLGGSGPPEQVAAYMTKDMAEELVRALRKHLAKLSAGEPNLAQFSEDGPGEE